MNKETFNRLKAEVHARQAQKATENSRLRKLHHTDIQTIQKQQEIPGRAHRRRLWHPRSKSGTRRRQAYANYGTSRPWRGTENSTVG